MTRKKQEQAKETTKRIPTFKSIEEEATFWNTHSSEEFTDELTPVEDVKFVKASMKKAFLRSIDFLPLIK
ncbi:MAG TPA: hypothetical protein VFA41_22160 [Ktedonobacteraceae bacterium]|jgi:hypothetical protein|nr:hypothetical protein [Ktedonobacteraceae bacterium]